MISAAAHLASLEPYDPKYWPARIYLNANENPYGLPQTVRSALANDLISDSDSQSAFNLHRYPDPLATGLRQELAQQLNRDAQGILLGNGGDELLLDLWLAYGGPNRRVISCPPAFSVYALDSLLTRTTHKQIALVPQSDAANATLSYELPRDELLKKAADASDALIVLTSPNNPTGGCIELSFLRELLETTPALVLLDQAYVEFANPRYDATVLLDEFANLVILRTFSKAYALAGLRIGYLLAAPAVISELKKVRQPYSLNSFSARAALLALQRRELYAPQLAEIVSQREQLITGLRALGMATAASEANFVLTRTKQARQLWQSLYEQFGILVRDFSAAPGLKDCLRITVGTPQENNELLAALHQLRDKQA